METWVLFFFMLSTTNNGINSAIEEIKAKAEYFLYLENNPDINTDTAYYYAQAYLDSIEIIKRCVK